MNSPHPPICCDKKAAESVFQQFKYVKPRLNKAAIELLCTAYEAAKETKPVSISLEKIRTLVLRDTMEEIPDYFLKAVLDAVGVKYYVD